LLAFAMQIDGWILRDVVCWAKKSPMPASLSGTAWTKCRVKVADGPRTTTQWNQKPPTESGGSIHCEPVWRDCPGCDRCRDNGGYVLRRGSWRTTTAHEYIFMFAKKAGYFADQQGVMEPCSEGAYARFGKNPNISRVNRKHEGMDGECMAAAAGRMPTWNGAAGRNPRSVQTFTRTNLKARHYAAFPVSLAEFCIKAATSSKGVCPAMLKRLRLRSDLTPEQQATVLSWLDAKGLLHA